MRKGLNLLQVGAFVLEGRAIAGETTMAGKVTDSGQLR